MSDHEKVPMLQTGYDTLEIELRQLKYIDRQEIVKAIEVARAHGDLSENAEYHAAKEQQGLTEARIKELEGSLSAADVIDPTQLSGTRVLFGATVTVLDEDDKKLTYQIVGRYEADVSAHKVSNSSPLGRALIGQKIGDDVEVITPSGEKYYRIQIIEFI
jgi:transcription elongation factor GreA